MKVYGCPDECPPPVPNYRNYDPVKERAAEDRHGESVKAWLVANGYAGKNTGEIVSFPVADGYASYMLGDGRTSCLIHLPYGDAYQYRDVVHLPKAEVLRRIASGKAMRAIFEKA